MNKYDCCIIVKKIKNKKTIQTILFNNGYKWYSGDKDFLLFQGENILAIFITHNKQMKYGIFNNIKDLHKHMLCYYPNLKKISYKNFIRKKIINKLLNEKE